MAVEEKQKKQIDPQKFDLSPHTIRAAWTWVALDRCLGISGSMQYCAFFRCIPEMNHKMMININNSMKTYIKMQTVVAACIIVLAVGTTGTISRADGATALENLEKLKKTNSCRGCDLSGLTINRTNLAGADLEGADLSRTKLFLSNLSGANMRSTNLKGASFGGTDLGEADLRGADLRGTSLEGAYLEETQLDGEFVTAKPYEDIGVPDVEKQVYVPNPEKPKKSPETRDVKVAARPDLEKTSREMAVEREPKPPSEKIAGTAQQPGAPTAKKAIPVRQAIVEPQDPVGGQAMAEPVGVTEPATAKAAANSTENGKSSTTLENMPKKMADVRKPPPVPPADVKIEEVQAVKTPEKTRDGGAGESAANFATDKSKRDRLTRLLDEDKCLGCDLSGLDLSGKNLKNVDLERANLSGCNLERVILDKANLKGAILQNAVLRMASLKNADLYKADLSGADLSGANVQGAKLDNAKVSTAVGLGTVGK
ncbi:MAG TPA: hypothetical protein DDY32_17010 [Desulfobulbaceae bacterium]|nr:hypothetical protein [Desulfobulbaceae bacterium]